MKMASPVEIHLGSETDALTQMLKGEALSPKTLRSEPGAEPLGGESGRTADSITDSIQSWCLLVLELDHKRRLTRVEPELHSSLTQRPGAHPRPGQASTCRRPLPEELDFRGHGSAGKRLPMNDPRPFPSKVMSFPRKLETFSSHQRKLQGAPPKCQLNTVKIFQ